MLPLVSIVVPAYNAAEYIREMINSVHQQTFDNWELIIVNDGSADKTVSVINEFSADKRIRLINQKNLGVSAARNAGINAAKGDFIGFMDADDAMTPENLFIKVEKLIQDPDADFVFSNVMECDEKLRTSGRVITGTDKNILEKILLWEGAAVPLPAGNVVARKKCFNDGICFDTSFSTAADQDFAIQLASRFKGKHLAEATICYRILPNGMSRNIKLMEQDHIGVYLKARKNNLFSSSSLRRKCFSNLYLILAGSWWVNGNNKKRAVIFIWKSLVLRPGNIFRLIKKIF
jgi:glycosyltransferase involved in cell wall biosynthesis